MLRTGVALIAGNFLIAVLNLIRNIFLAQILDVADFGISATFTIFSSMMAMFFSAVLATLLVQRRTPDVDRMQNAFHFAQMIQALIAAGILYVAAVPFADFMGTPVAVWAYQGIAVASVLYGFNHLDVHRLQRDMIFAPYVLLGLLPIVVSMIALWPLYQMFPDWRCVFWMIIIQMVATTATSHIVSRRPFRMTFDMAHFRTAIIFGVPLLGESLLFFVILNGERMIVSGQYGLETLAQFSVAFMLIALPVAVMSRSFQSLFLPVLSARQNTASEFTVAAVFTSQALMFAGGSIAAGFVVVGPAVILLLYGDRYIMAIPFGILLAVMQGIRLARVGPLDVCLAKGNSRPSFWTSIVRVTFIFAAFLVGTAGYDITIFILVGIAGEVLAYAAALYFAGRADRDLLVRIPASLLWFTAVLATSALKLLWGQLDALPGWYVTRFDLVIIAVFATAPLLMPDLRNWFLAQLRRRTHELPPGSGG